MQIQPIQTSRAIGLPERSTISQNPSCLEKIKEWFKRVWETIVRSCSCSQKKQITSQVQPITPIINQPIAPPPLQPPQPIIPNPEGPYPERDAPPLEELAPPLQPPPAPIPPPLPPLLRMTHAERQALVRHLQERPIDQDIHPALNRLIENNHALASKALFGILLHIWTPNTIHGRARGILNPGHGFVNPQNRQQLGVTDDQYERILATARVIVDNPNPTREQRQAFLKLFCDTHTAWELVWLRDRGVTAEAGNHLNVAQGCLDMVHSLANYDDAAVIRAAEALALEADRFLNQV